MVGEIGDQEPAATNAGDDLVVDDVLVALSVDPKGVVPGGLDRWPDGLIIEGRELWSERHRHKSVGAIRIEIQGFKVCPASRRDSSCSRESSFGVRCEQFPLNDKVVQGDETQFGPILCPGDGE